MIEVKNELKVKPDFMIIGTQRGGTTSLWEYLRQHPSTCLSKVKETYFFDNQFGNGLDWYQEYLPTLEQKEKILAETGAFATGEATPYYMFYPHTPSRIHQLFPRTKFIVMLRNPVERAFSHWKLEAARGNEVLDFEDALNFEPERLLGKEAQIIRSPDIKVFEHFCHTYMSKGLYAKQLRRWFKYFPRSQFLIIKSEEFFNDPSFAYQHILRFLGLPGGSKPIDFKPHNVGNKAEMSPEIRKRLVETFLPYNMDLYKLIGRDLGWT